MDVRSLFGKLVALAAMIATGVMVRLALHEEIPNFAPVAGLALFAGYFFRDRVLGAMVPVGIMFISNLVIGGYELVVMLAVYGCLVVPALAGPWMRSWLPLEKPGIAPAATSAAAVLGGAALGSILFFVVTNLAVWAVGHGEEAPMYTADLAGLTRCYEMALPFFRYTLAGDLCFAGLLFGSYGAALQLGFLESSREVAEAKS